LDVLDLEKDSLTGLQPSEWPPVLKAFLQHPQALITPHIAGWSHQSFPKMAQALLDKWDRWNGSNRAQ
jgi:D-3-phosphoglycerate dehydrogenase